MFRTYGTSKDILTFDSYILPFYYPIYFTITMFTQLSVLALVIFRTPPFFRDFRIFLVNSSILQILMCTMVCFTQVRPVYNANSTALLFSGQCKLFNKLVCLFSFDFFQVIFDASSCAVPCTLWYKYTQLSKMGKNMQSKTLIRIILSCAYIFPIFVTILYVLDFDSFDFSVIENDLIREYNGTYKLTEYAQITGYLNDGLTTVINTLNTMSVYIPPIISLVFIRLIQRNLGQLKNMFTDKTAQQARKFDLALIIQTLLPVVCVLPAYTLHMVTYLIGVQDLVYLDKCIYIMLGLPTAIDGFIVITTIAPYRRGFVSFFTRQEYHSQQVTTIGSSRSTLHLVNSNHNPNARVFKASKKTVV